MHSIFIKKVIASTLLFTITVGSGLLLSSKSVQAVSHHECEVEFLIGNIPTTEYTIYEGQNALVIPIPKDTKYKHVFLEGEPDYFNEILVDDKLIITGLKEGETYENISLIVKCSDVSEDMDYRYKIDNFKFNGKDLTNTSVSTDKKPLLDYLVKSYKNVMGKDIPNEKLKDFESKIKYNNFSLTHTFTSMVSNDAFISATPKTEDKIKKIYMGIFHREADMNGLKYWVKKYDEKMKLIKDPKAALKSIIIDMTSTDEFKKVIANFGLKN